MQESPDGATRAAELLLEGEATALTRKAVELTLAGDPTALRLCLDRTVAPRRERSVELGLPPIRSATDVWARSKRWLARSDVAPSPPARRSRYRR
jgi:hypothetical protein